MTHRVDELKNCLRSLKTKQVIDSIVKLLSCQYYLEITNKTTTVYSICNLTSNS